ncbi:MAG: M1 family aminopeptidase, partial [Desulfocapsaceae bacterium]|nr:M1 family aminopeptidase [Desulfocapsaceae bacterium]
MSPLFTMFTCPLAIAVLVLAQIIVPTSSGAQEDVPHIDLGISFDTGQALLRGTMKVEIASQQAITFRLDGLRVTGAVISSAGQENRSVVLSGSPVLSLEPSAHEKTLFISYEKGVSDGFRDIISPESIVLTSLWHPLPDSRSTFSVKAQVPPGFTAVCESDSFSETSPDGSAYFSFSQPVFSLNFAAAPYVMQSSQVRDGLHVHTLFFPEDQHLAPDYLSAAVEYIKRYERLIGPFPYNHYLIVENVNPTGFGMPTFTLLGKQVLKLPFIKETSLGHEILHSWFGNSVTVSRDSGNWCEGLTTYLADMAYRDDRGEGVLSRKEKILEYLSYVTAITSPLNQFHSAGHSTDTNRAVRAVGYGRSAMLFHELNSRLGEKHFYQAIRDFYKQYSGSAASWQDLEEIFANQSGENLQRFFDERLNTTHLPDIVATDLRVLQESETSSLSFSIEQKSPEPFEIMVPFTVKTIAGENDFRQLITEKTTDISIRLEGYPLELIIDEDYDLMRNLTDREYVPVWSQLLGNPTTVILADEQERAIYQPFLDMASRYSWQIQDPGESESIDTTGGFLIYLGLSSPLSRSMYGTPPH